MREVYKHDKQVTYLSRQLPPITAKQIEWGFDHCLEKLFHLSRGKNYCLECGHEWKAENKRKDQVCPECHQKLTRIDEYKSYRSHAEYFGVLSICEGYQVVRIIYLDKSYKLNRKAHCFHHEVMQYWIDETGYSTIMSKAVAGLSQRADQWIFSSEIKIRRSYSYSAQFRFKISPYKCYPEMQILPAFKRNGFKGDFLGCGPVQFLNELLRNSKLETLLKAKQYSLAAYAYRQGGISSDYWPSVKICIRNKYIVQDASVWLDHIQMLKRKGKDIRNAFYVCPKDLMKIHNRMVAKRLKEQKKEQIRRAKEAKLMNAQQQIERLKKERKRLIQEQFDYEIQKQDFFDLNIKEGQIAIVPLKSIDDFQYEGNTLQHCVFTNKYYNKADSLILSARIDDKPIETIELSLESLTVIQCRGLLNKSTPYHDRILEIVNKNIPVIAKRVKSKNLNMAV